MKPEPKLNWMHLVIRFNDGTDKTLETWVDTNKPFSIHRDGELVHLLKIEDDKEEE